VYIDSFFYGKTVIAPLGIVLYNVFGKGGPNLYGEAKTRLLITHSAIHVCTFRNFFIFKKGPKVMSTNYHELISYIL